MRKIIFFLSTGYYGMDSNEIHEYDDEVTHEILDNEAWQLALSNAEMYGIYPESDLEGISEQDYEELEESGELDNYSSNIEGYWEDYDETKHARLI